MTEKKESKLANYGCLTVIVILVIVFILIPKPKTPNSFTFDIVSEYDKGKNAKVMCFYTDCPDYDMIKTHAYNQGSRTENSVVIFYFNNKNKIPDISKSGFIIDDKYTKRAIATYKKYGHNVEEFTTK